jgi:eukaryotic-like serine/threonine-protein kinase
MSKVFTITEGLENLGAIRTGGQGSVYKARRIGPMITAVKLIPTPVSDDNENDRNYRNFKNEVEKLKRVNQEPNPNVVKILSSGVTETGSFPFIEMEYVEGPDLEELLKSPHDPIFSIKETIKLADQLACALSHCHRVGVRHGDVKSNNIKFSTSSGNYVLLDFGLAIMSDEQRRSSMRNAGAIEFMAPEQYEGQMLFQTDVYSYGVVLFELLTGQVPFPLKDGGETARNMVRLQHMEEPVPDLLQLRRQNMPTGWSDEKKALEMQVPDWLVNLVYTCLKKNPDERYTDGVALHEALSIRAISGGTNAELQAENAMLKQKITDIEVVAAKPPINVSNTGGYITVQEAYRRRSVRIYRSWVVFLAIILAILVTCIFAGAFTSKGDRQKINALQDSLSSAQTRAAKDSATIKRLNRKYSQALKAQATLRRELKEDSLELEHPLRRIFSDSTDNHPHRHRRFLGLF